MGLLDIFKKKAAPSAGEMAAVPAMQAISSARGPPGMGMPGLSSPPGAGTPSRPPMPGAPSATPMFPQTQPLTPSAPFGPGKFSPIQELKEVQTVPSYPAQVAAPTSDLGKKIGHLEDRMEIMNEKLDLILRELRNIYERGAGRRI
jgi:hypothetical protein